MSVRVKVVTQGVVATGGTPEFNWPAEWPLPQVGQEIYLPNWPHPRPVMAPLFMPNGDNKVRYPYVWITTADARTSTRGRFCCKTVGGSSLGMELGCPASTPPST